MRKKRAFTLPEIIIVVLLVSAILGVVYKIFSGIMGQMFKSSNKMTNLRAASLILEKIKSDLRCAIVPSESQKPVIEDGKFSFYTTSIDGNVSGSEEVNSTPRQVTYIKDGDILRREVGDSNKKFNTAKVTNFEVKYSDTDYKDSSYIKVTIAVDDEMSLNTNRTLNSKNNQVELKAVLYPRFLEKTVTEQEKYWHNTSRGSGSDSD